MKSKRRLIPPPLEWRMTAAPVPPPVEPVQVLRGGTALRVPLPTLLVDTREKNPFSFRRFRGWFNAVEEKALALGDYSIAGMEHVCAVERKDLPDLVNSFTSNRSVFVKRLQRMSAAPHRLLVVTAALSEVKSSFGFSAARANLVTQSLVATLAGLQVPFLCTQTHELGEEMVASYLYQLHLYHWLEQNGEGRFLADDDL